MTTPVMEVGTGDHGRPIKPHETWRKSARFWRRVHAGFLWLAVDYNGRSRFPHRLIHDWFNRRWNPDWYAELAASKASTR
jgi:hypothetical protein